MTHPVQVAFVALGCAKNLVDSEKMLGQLAEAGAVITADESAADVIVINTCGFLQASRAEAHEAIAGAIARKKTGRCRRVVVAGCLVQRDTTRLFDDFPGIDALVGVHRRDDLVRAVMAGPDGDAGSPGGKKTARRGRPDLYLEDYHPYVAVDTARLRVTPRHYAYLRISEGCDQKCTFCTIPMIRGRMHSKPPEAVLAEARELAGDGAVEINLIAQDTTGYGRDIGYKPGLAGLLRRLNRLDGPRWLRLLYAYPTVFTDDIIDALAGGGHIVPYVDIPLQHINDRILKAMGRRVTRVETETLLHKLRRRVPGIAIRTTFMTGFPGETRAEFGELLQFVRDMRFAAVGVFAFSSEPETAAGRMKNTCSEKVARQRADLLMKTQQEIAFADAAAWAGKTFEVLIEQQVRPGQFAGRHAGQAPEVDAVTYVLADHARAGSFLQAACVGSRGYDLITRPADAILPRLS